MERYVERTEASSNPKSRRPYDQGSNASTSAWIGKGMTSPDSTQVAAQVRDAEPDCDAKRPVRKRTRTKTPTEVVTALRAKWRDTAATMRAVRHRRAVRRTVATTDGSATSQ